MVRPCYLIVDREFPGSISTRKLVVETAKYNVITAYSGKEALATLKLFPAVHAVVMDQDMPDIPCEELIEGFRTIQPKIPVVLICSPGRSPCESADYRLEPYSPRGLLDILARIEPKVSAELIQHEEDLAANT